MQRKMLYEVETRVYFNSTEEAYNILPFLKDCLKYSCEWQTSMYGIDLFKSGKLLRTSTVKSGDRAKSYWGYKDDDLGKFYNIRNEIDEEITNGIDDSYILQVIGGLAQEVNNKNVKQVLNSLGYEEFMSFVGNNLTGHHEKLDLALKLLFCPVLKYPLMLEIEKNAETLDEAYEKELDLKDFIKLYKLEDRTLKDEPVTFLYQTL